MSNLILEYNSKHALTKTEKMKIKSLLLLTFLWSSNFLSAQQNIFIDVEASVLAMQEYKYEQIQEFTSFREELISENTIVRSTFQSESLREITYNPELGFELASNVNFILTKNLSIRAGMAVNLMQFNTTDEFIGSNSTLLSMDTTLITAQPATPLTGITCTSFLNMRSDFGDLEDGEFYDIVSLRIPFNISYKLFNSKVTIGAGGYLQTPVFNRFNREYLSFNFDIDPLDETSAECSYSLVEEENNFGDGIQSLSFGFNLSLAYQIANNIDIQVSLLKDVTNTFHDDSNAFFATPSNELFPTRLALGLRYSFVGNKSEE